MKLRELKEMLNEIDEDIYGDVVISTSGLHLEILDVKLYGEIGAVRIVVEDMELAL